MPRCTRSPSRRIVCMQSPPLPGCHLRACSWLLMPGTSSQESPPSPLLNSAAGSTPHQSSFLLSPDSRDQMLASARPSSFGKAGADDGDHIAQDERCIEPVAVAHVTGVHEQIDVPAYH